MRLAGPQTVNQEREQRVFGIKAVNEFKQGDLVKVRLTVHTPEARYNMVVVDLLPGGFEIEDSSLKTRAASNSKKLKNPIRVDNVEKVDDRLLLFGGTGWKESAYVYEYTVRAITRGRFQVPAVSDELMYEPEVRAYKSSTDIIVIK